MPLPIHMFIKGVTEKACDIKGREDSALCQEFKYKLSLPPNSERVHSPVTITKALDRTSPLLYASLCGNKPLDKVTFKFYRITPTGHEEHFYTIELENALIVEVEPWMPNALDESKADHPYMENVSFRFKRIRWEWLPDGIESEDGWAGSSAR